MEFRHFRIGLVVPNRGIAGNAFHLLKLFGFVPNLVTCKLGTIYLIYKSEDSLTPLEGLEIW